MFGTFYFGGWFEWTKNKTEIGSHSLKKKIVQSLLVFKIIECCSRQRFGKELHEQTFVGHLLEKPHSIAVETYFQFQGFKKKKFPSSFIF